MVDQNSQFYAILTNVGAAKQANADALGIAWKITQLAVGDANGTDPTPSATQTRLINEWRRAPLNQLKVDDKDPSIIVAEQVIPADVGGKWIREIGLYDADGDLVAVANCAPTYKPLLSQGSGRTQIVRMSLVVSSAANVQLKIDPSVVLATREWVTEELARQDFKHSVLVATTAGINLSGLQTIDGVALTAGARVLVKNQAAAKENGIYTVVAGGAWTRSVDADSNAKVTPGLLVLVERGTVNSDSAWQLVTDAPISLGVTALTFEMAFGRSGVLAGTYRSVQVDKYGRVVAATNPTTVAGYGLTDVYTKSETYNRTEISKAIGDAVTLAVNGLVDSAPGALDTLKELADAIGNDPSFATTMVNELAKKAPLASPKFTGAPEVPTPAASSKGLQAANMAALATAVAASARQFKSAVIGVSGNLTLTAAQMGNAVQFNSGPVTLALPALADVGHGASVMLRNPSPTATQTIVVAASGSIVDAGSTVGSMALKPLEWVELASSGTVWFVVGRGKLKEVAELDSPVFTGDPQVPTKGVSDKTNSVANTEFVQLLISSYGLGARYAGAITDLDDPSIGNGLYAVNQSTSAGVKPTGMNWGIVFVAGRSNTSGASGRVMQTFFATDSAATRQLFRTYFNGSWSAWEEVSTLTAVQNALLAVGLGVAATPPALVDVDSASTPTGLYRVSAPKGTLPAGVSRYGTFFVERYTAASIRQRFSPIGGGEGREFTRTLSPTEGWLNWAESAQTASPAFTGDVGVPTRPTSDRSGNAASTQFVANLLASLGWGTNDLSDLPTGVDLNTMNVGGSYQVNGALNSPPGGGGSGVLFVVGANAQNYTHQLFFPQGGNKMYHRCSYGATNGVVNWRDWDENPDMSTVSTLIKANRRYFSGNVVGVGAPTTLTAAQTGYAFNVTSPVTVTLPTAADAGPGGSFTIRNVSNGNVTIALTSGLFYVKAGSSSNLVLGPNEWVEIQASASNYFLNARGKLGEVAETDSPTFKGEVTIKGANVLRLINSSENYAVIPRIDERDFYLLLTDPGNSSGNFNSLRPFQFNLATGAVTMSCGVSVLSPADDDNSSRAPTTLWVNKKVDMAAPVGQVAHFARNTPPAGWLKRNGAAVSRTTYAALFAAIGTQFGAGNGSTTFNLPDDRELIDRAWTDGLNAADSGRALFSSQAGQNESHIHEGTTNSTGAHTHVITNKREYVDGVSTSNVNAVYGDQIIQGTDTTTTSASGTHSHTLTISANGGNETRMANRAYLACIKY